RSRFSFETWGRLSVTRPTVAATLPSASSSFTSKCTAVRASLTLVSILALVRLGIWRLLMGYARGVFHVAATIPYPTRVSSDIHRHYENVMYGGVGTRLATSPPSPRLTAPAGLPLSVSGAGEPAPCSPTAAAPRTLSLAQGGHPGEGEIPGCSRASE